MIYGIWFFPLLFVGLYFFLFRQSVLSTHDEARFRELLEENDRQEEVA